MFVEKKNRTSDTGILTESADTEFHSLSNEWVFPHSQNSLDDFSQSHNSFKRFKLLDITTQVKGRLLYIMLLFSH